MARVLSLTGMDPEQHSSVRDGKLFVNDKEVEPCNAKSDSLEDILDALDILSEDLTQATNPKDAKGSGVPDLVVSGSALGLATQCTPRGEEHGYYRHHRFRLCSLLSQSTPAVVIYDNIWGGKSFLDQK
eukprot:2967667-Amphidinium_carterae.1